MIFMYVYMRAFIRECIRRSANGDTFPPAKQ